jgi:hypothetical protein
MHTISILLSLMLIALLLPVLVVEVLWAVFPEKTYDKKRKWYKDLRLLLSVLICVLLTWVYLYLNNYFR